MAMMDYGAIAFKNGKLISTEHFTPMFDMVGWEDTNENVYTHYDVVSGKGVELPLELKGNYFAYIGDIDCTVAFYKTSIVIVERYNSNDKKYFRTYENLCNDYKWSKWIKYAGESHIKITKRNGYYICKWKYKGDKYKVYFGYGVDLDYYKKWRMVNYYRSPKFLAHKAKWRIKDKIEFFKWKHFWK